MYFACVLQLLFQPLLWAFHLSSSQNHSVKKTCNSAKVLMRLSMQSMSTWPLPLPAMP